MSTSIRDILATNKIIDAEKMQSIDFYLIESFRAYAESERQHKISEEFGDKAIELILSENINIDDILKAIKEKLENNEYISKEL